MSRKLTTEEFIARAQQVHHDKYEYYDYYGYDRKIKINCHLHGIFEQTPHNHLNGSICPDCAHNSRSIIYRKDQASFIKEANSIYDLMQKKPAGLVPADEFCPVKS